MAAGAPAEEDEPEEEGGFEEEPVREGDGFEPGEHVSHDQLGKRDASGLDIEGAGAGMKDEADADVASAAPHEALADPRNLREVAMGIPPRPSKGEDDEEAEPEGFPAIEGTRRHLVRCESFTAGHAWAIFQVMRLMPGRPCHASPPFRVPLICDGEPGATLRLRRAEGFCPVGAEG